MFSEIQAILKLVKIVKKIDRGEAIPQQLFKWYEKQINQFRSYMGPITCPKCKEKYDLPNEVARRCFRAVFKALTHGGKKV